MTPRPAGAKSRSSRSRISPPRGSRMRPRDDHGLDAEALGLARVAVDQRARLVGREVDLRPHVQPHAVPQQPLARRAAGLEAAQRVQRLGQHVLELGQRDDAAASSSRTTSARGPRRARTAARPSGSCGRRRGTGRRPRATGCARARTPTCATGSAARPAPGGRTAGRGRSPSRRRATRRSVIASAAETPRPGAGTSSTMRCTSGGMSARRAPRAASFASSSPAVAPA